jgi:hypothetical protein
VNGRRRVGFGEISGQGAYRPRSKADPPVSATRLHASYDVLEAGIVVTGTARSIQ